MLRLSSQTQQSRVRAQLELLLRNAEPGERLPSEPALAKHFGVSRTTIREVMSQLEAEGFICCLGPKLVIDENIMATIRQAILKCHQIKIKYYNKNSGKISTNTLNPHGFLYGERNHYLVAHHADGYLGNEVHNFILSNIREVEILNSVIENLSDFNLQSSSLK